MPEIAPTTDESGMDDAFYSDSGSGDEGTSKDAPESIDEEESKNPTALIPTSALGGTAKEGDTITMKVVKVYDDEAEVEISSSDKETPKEAQSPDEELDSMASMKG